MAEQHRAERDHGPQTQQIAHETPHEHPRTPEWKEHKGPKADGAEWLHHRFMAFGRTADSLERAANDSLLARAFIGANKQGVYDQ